jgi:hypothetical protein
VRQVAAQVVGQCHHRGVALCGGFAQRVRHDVVEVAFKAAPQARDRGGALAGDALLLVGRRGLTRLR